MSTVSVDPDLKDRIQAVVDRLYEDEDKLSMRVALITEYLTTVDDVETNVNEVRVACDQLVDEDRLVFLKDLPRGGRRYCSTKVPDERIAALEDDI